MSKDTAPSLNQVLFNLSDFPLKSEAPIVLNSSTGSADSKKDKKTKEPVQVVSTSRILISALFYNR